MNWKQRTLFVLDKFRHALPMLRSLFYRTTMEKRWDNWLADGGPNFLRQEYELDENSIVFDLGGYDGQWSSDIYGRYSCRIYICEPVPEFAERIRKRFHENRKIHVLPTGIAGESRNEEITVSAYGSSIFKKRFKKEGCPITIRMVQASQVFSENDIDHVDLMKINIEGGEYELLEHLIDNRFIERVTDVQVQFHNIFPDAEARMHRIQESLRETHSLTYQYEFIFENWRRKASS